MEGIESQVATVTSVYINMYINSSTQLLTHALGNGLGVAEGEEDEDERGEEGRLDEVGAPQAVEAEKALAEGRPTASGLSNPVVARLNVLTNK